MKICNADKLKKHFENVVDVKLFTPAQICTIIDTFSVEIKEDAQVVMPRHLGMNYVNEMQDFLNKLHEAKPIGGAEP